MKLSTKKQLLEEAESVLKQLRKESIKKSLNEAPDRLVDKSISLNKDFKALTDALNGEQDEIDEELWDYRKKLLNKYSSDLNQRYSNTLKKFIGKSINSFYKAPYAAISKADQNLLGIPITSVKLKADYNQLRYAESPRPVVYIVFELKGKTKTFSIDVREIYV